jgi:hypothetical protein
MPPSLLVYAVCVFCNSVKTLYRPLWASLINALLVCDTSARALTLQLDRYTQA